MGWAVDLYLLSSICCIHFCSSAVLAQTNTLESTIGPGWKREENISCSVLYAVLSWTRWFPLTHRWSQTCVVTCQCPRRWSGRWVQRGGGCPVEEKRGGRERNKSVQDFVTLVMWSMIFRTTRHTAQASYVTDLRNQSCQLVGLESEATYTWNLISTEKERVSISITTNTVSASN